MADASPLHAEHDPLRIAALIGEPADGAADPEARGWADECPTCAALYADLLVLSMATRAMPAPPRTRDFQLTAADAVRLTEAGARHAAHDRELVAAYADGSIDPKESPIADALVASCADCAALDADLRALAGATRAMSTPPRPRDFTLTPDDAARLRPAGWRRFIAGIGTSRDALSRPLAIGLTTLGLVGVLIAGAPSILWVGSSASSLDTVGAPIEAGGPVGAAAPSDAGAVSGLASAAPKPATGVQPDTAGDPDNVDGAPDASPVAVASPGSSVGPAVVAPPLAAATTEPGSKDLNDGSSVTPERVAGTGSTSDGPTTGTTPMLWLSALFLVAGLGLFAIRWRARRLGDG